MGNKQKPGYALGSISLSLSGSKGLVVTAPCTKRQKRMPGDPAFRRLNLKNELVEVSLQESWLESALVCSEYPALEQ